jgi:hypothetical protein
MEHDPISPAFADDRPPDPPRPPPLRDLPDAIPLWRLYWFALGTLGIYIPIWVCRTAKRSWGGRPPSDTPIWWAFGSLAPPACAAILIEFKRRACAELKSAGIAKIGTAGAPAILYFIILLIGTYSPLSGFVPTLLFLLPLPFLMVQSTINQIHAVSAAPAARPTRQVHPVEWIGASFGTTALALIVWIYAPALLPIFAPRHGAGATISSVSGHFTVTLPSDNWRVVNSGTLGDEESDLELIGPGVESWIIAYNLDRRQIDFELTIDNRRGECTAGGKLTSLKESRRFLDGPDLIPISIAEYEVHAGLLGTWSCVVLTAQLEERIIEIIGYSIEPDLHLDEVRKLAVSFLPVAQDEES